MKGYASLYYYETLESSVYILEQEGEPLQYLQGQPGDPLLMDQQSREKLKAFLSGCLELAGSAETLSFHGKDLIRLTKQYNRCTRADREMLLYRQGKEKAFRVGVTAGLNLSDLEVHGNIPYRNVNLRPGLGFNVGVGFDFSFLKRFSLDVKTLLVSSNSSLWDYPVEDPDTTFREDDVLFNFLYIDIPVTIKVNLTSGRMKTFVMGGIWYGVLVEQDIASQSTFPERSTPYTLDIYRWKQGYSAGLGIIMPSSRRSVISFEIGYIYQKAGGGSSDGFTMNSIFLQMSYLF